VAAAESPHEGSLAPMAKIKVEGPVIELVSLLAGVGAMLGRGPHLVVGNTRHSLTTWPLLFGRTSDGRKGEAWSSARAVLDKANQLVPHLEPSGRSCIFR
jgi:hypothetical protein